MSTYRYILYRLKQSGLDEKGEGRKKADSSWSCTLTSDSQKE